MSAPYVDLCNHTEISVIVIATCASKNYAKNAVEHIVKFVCINVRTVVKHIVGVV